MTIKRSDDRQTGSIAGKKGCTKIAGGDRRLGLDEANPIHALTLSPLSQAAVTPGDRNVRSRTRDTEREARRGDDCQVLRLLHMSTSPPSHLAEHQVLVPLHREFGDRFPFSDDFAGRDYDVWVEYDMSEMVTVQFLDLRIHRMPANDVLQLRRRLPPLELNCVQSVDQFKRFQAFLAIVTSQTDLARICATRGEELDELGIVEEYDDDDDDDDDDDGDEHYVYGGLDMFEPATTDEEDANAQVDADDLYYLGVSDDENEEVGSDGGTDDDGGDDAGGDGGRAGPLRWDNLWDDDPPQ
uniref:Expressed protein n=1 Tax=Oryza sativa subsp. japonica TaxID=39947 RepID=Q10LV4_ORYSJ|nr:expressed protein [Oryza sativa Japonica Group]